MAPALPGGRAVPFEAELALGQRDPDHGDAEPVVGDGARGDVVDAQHAALHLDGDRDPGNEGEHVGDRARQPLLEFEAGDVGLAAQRVVDGELHEPVVLGLADTGAARGRGLVREVVDADRTLSQRHVRRAAQAQEGPIAALRIARSRLEAVGLANGCEHAGRSVVVVGQREIAAAGPFHLPFEDEDEQPLEIRFGLAREADRIAHFFFDEARAVAFVRASSRLRRRLRRTASALT